MFYKNFMRADAPIQIREENFTKNWALITGREVARTMRSVETGTRISTQVSQISLWLSSENAEKGGLTYHDITDGSYKNL